PFSTPFRSRVARVVHLRGAVAGSPGARLAVVLARLGHAVAALGLAHLVSRLVLLHVVGLGEAGDEGAEGEGDEGPGGSAHGVLLSGSVSVDGSTGRVPWSSLDSLAAPPGLQ